MTPGERAELERMTRTGKAAAAKLTHARILLLADESPGGPGRSDGQVIEAPGASKNTICRVRERFVEQGFEAALVRKPATRVYARKLDGRGEAFLIAPACSDPPTGRANWTPQLLAHRMVTLGHAGTPSDETVRQVLKKRDQGGGLALHQPWLKRMGCIPPEQSAEFVAPMEDVPGVYERPYDPAYPQGCLDETNRQSVGEVREPLAMTPGEPQRYDSEYVRNGSAGLALHHGEPVRRRREERESAAAPRPAGSLGGTWR